jgi:hypothetical protein
MGKLGSLVVHFLSLTTLAPHNSCVITASGMSHFLDTCPQRLLVSSGKRPCLAQLVCPLVSRRHFLHVCGKTSTWGGKVLALGCRDLTLTWGTVHPDSHLHSLVSFWYQARDFRKM